jgi:signal peptidase I
MPRRVLRSMESALKFMVYNLDYLAMREGPIPEICFPRVSAVSAGRRRNFFDSRYWLRDMVLSVLAAFTAFLFLYQPVQVEGTSMLPLLQNHERIVVNKIAYHVESIHRGDIIVFRYPLDPAESFIKRVIGLPGDWVSIKNGHVYVNGKRLKEPYIQPGYMGQQTCAPVHVAPDHYYVLGDHRDFSNDSREWGTVARKYIYGKAVFAYWPLSDLGLLQ